MQAFSGIWRIALALLALAFAPTASALDPITLKPLQVGPNTWYFQGESGMATAANKAFMSNAGFVVTKDGVVVFDTLGSPALGDAMLKAIRSVTPQPVKRVIVSHYHADHFYGLQAFKAQGAEIWAHENGRGYLESEQAQQRLAQRRADLAPWVDQDTRMVAADRWLKFSNGKRIPFEMGGIRFQIIDSSGAHSNDDIMLSVDNDGVLFAGDLFFTGRIPFVGDANSKVWLVALDRMLELKPRMVVPGHGRSSTEPVKDIQLTRNYLQFLRKAMGDAVSDMMPFEEAYKKTDWSAYSKYPAFEAANRGNAYGTYILMEKESLQK